MATKHDDAQTIVGQELADELEKRSKGNPVSKSESFDPESAENFLVVRSESDEADETEEITAEVTKSEVDEIEDGDIEIIVKGGKGKKKKKKVVVVSDSDDYDDDAQMSLSDVVDKSNVDSETESLEMSDNTQRIDELTQGFGILTESLENLTGVVGDLVEQSSSHQETLNAFIEASEAVEEVAVEDEETLVLDDNFDAGEVLQSLAGIVEASGYDRNQKYEMVSETIEGWLPTIKSAIDASTPYTGDTEAIEEVRQSQAETQAALAETTKSLAQLSEAVNKLSEQVQTQKSEVEEVQEETPVAKSVSQITVPAINGQVMQSQFSLNNTPKTNSLRSLVRKSVGLNQ